MGLNMGLNLIFWVCVLLILFLLGFKFVVLAGFGFYFCFQFFYLVRINKLIFLI